MSESHTLQREIDTIHDQINHLIRALPESMEAEVLAQTWLRLKEAERELRIATLNEMGMISKELIHETGD